MTTSSQTHLRLAGLARNAPNSFLIEPDANARAMLARELGILGVKKLRFEGMLSPEGKTDWHLKARLGATVVQPCVATLEPVTTRIEEDVSRAYVAAYEEPEGGVEQEMPEDDTVDPLPATLDLNRVMAEALALGLPAYPRADGTEPLDTQVAAPGVAPLTDDDVKPFAGLASLRDKLSGDKDS